MLAAVAAHSETFISLTGVNPWKIVGVVIFLLSLVAFLIAVLGLINPAWARLPNRKASVKVWLVSVILLIVAVNLAKDGDTTPTSSASRVADRYLLQAEQKVRTGDFAGARTSMERLQALQRTHGLEPTPEALELMKRVESGKDPTARAAKKSRSEPAPPQPPVQLRTAPEPTPVPRLQPGVDSTCEGRLNGAACWMELESHPGCYVWVDFYVAEHTNTWSASCDGGLANGSGTLSAKWGSRVVGESTGLLRGGKSHGQWVTRNTDGTAILEGSYVDGRKHGQWVERLGNGLVWEGPYVDGKRHGRWINRYADGTVDGGSYVDGKKHGQWVERYASGWVKEGSYAHGKRHGRWVERSPDGNTETTTWSNGIPD